MVESVERKGWDGNKVTHQSQDKERQSSTAVDTETVGSQWFIPSLAPLHLSEHCTSCENLLGLRGTLPWVIKS